MSIRLAIAAAALMLAGLIGWAWRDNSADAEMATVVAERATERAEAAERLATFEEMARQQEHRHAEDMERIGRETEERLKEAGDAAYNRAVSDVRAGRLRNVWSCPAAPALPGLDRPAPGGDAEARDREAAVARVLRIGAEADAALAGCQAVVRADRDVR